MSNGYTAQYVRIVETDDAKHPITLRFGPHTDARGALTDRWTVEHLSEDQARRLVYDLAGAVGLRVQDPSAVVRRPSDVLQTGTARADELDQTAVLAG